MVEKHRKANAFLICITFITKGLLKIQTSENRGHTFVLLSRRGGLLHFFAQRAIFFAENISSCPVAKPIPNPMHSGIYLTLQDLLLL